MIRLVPVACALAFVLPGAAAAQSVSGPAAAPGERPAPPRNCRVLAQQPAAQPSAAPKGGTMTLVVLVPRTTCNTR